MNKQIQNQKLSMLPYAQIVPAGDFLFTAGLIAPDVDKPTPMKEFPVRHQTRGIYGPLSAALPKYGTELRNIVSLLQFFRGRGQTGAYIGERKKFFTDGVPTSTGIGCNDLLTPDTVLQVDGIIAVPSNSKTVKHHAGASGKAGYSHAVSFGDFVFFSGLTPSTTKSTAAYLGAVGTSLPEEARIDPNFWFGIAVQPQTRYIMETKLKPILDDVGVTIKDMAVALVHLENPKADLPGFVEVWNELYAGKPPLTVISPSKGLGSLGATIEITPFAIKPRSGTKVTDISVKGLESFCGVGPLARRVGDLVFTSTLAAVDDCGLLAEAKSPARGPNLFDQTEREMSIVLERLAQICSAAGGSLDDVVKLRVYLTGMDRLPAAYRPVNDRLKGRAAFSPVAIEGVSEMFPGCTLCVDAVAYIPAK